MSTRNRVTVTLDGRVAVVRGWRAADLIKEAGGKAIYAGSAGGWMVDRHRVSDLLAYLEQRNIAATVSRHDESTYLPRKGADAPFVPDVVDAEIVEDGGLW
ncbi:hypothetical protein ACOACQ_17695 [Nocardioides sp. CPCC 206347]|uniref:hypothetical protein n=1 Tax=unclassified Nocardioides TaxID=2615069 RepID=UPI003611EB7F